jgi:DNA-binding YbaB/EbfC family protein
MNTQSEDELLRNLCAKWNFSCNFPEAQTFAIVCETSIYKEEKVARRGGFSGGMPGNMNNLMKQAQKMQRQMEENQKALEEAEFKSTSGGGAVEVTVNGKKEVTKLKIDPEAVDPEDVEMLEDMIIAALNEAFRQVDDQKAKMMGQFGGGMGGLGSGLF